MIDLDKILTVALLIFISIFIRICLQFLGQQWIRTMSHTATLVLLPIITYVITNVISKEKSNAASLGGKGDIYKEKKVGKIIYGGKRGSKLASKAIKRNGITKIM